MIRTGLDPADFEWEDTRGDYGVRSTSFFRYKRTGHYLRFNLRDTDYDCVYTPGTDMPYGDHLSDSWCVVIEHLKAWLEILRRSKTFC